MVLIIKNSTFSTINLLKNVNSMRNYHKFNETKHILMKTSKNDLFSLLRAPLRDFSILDGSLDLYCIQPPAARKWLTSFNSLGNCQRFNIFEI